MIITGALDSLPLWGIFLLSLLITFLSLELGFLLGKRRRRRLGEGEKIFTGPVVAASFSLLAFILAMTFSTVHSRFNELKHLAVDEANAIGTAFLRADLLPGDDRAEVRQLLRDYVDLRVVAVSSDEEEIALQAIEESERMQDDLWSTTTAVAEENPTPISALFIQSLNELIDIYGKKITLSIHYRLPGAIWVMLYGLAFLAMAIGGYDTGVSGSRSVVTVMLAAALAFSIVFMLVVALDRPEQHLTSATEATMIDLQKDLRSSMEGSP